MNDKRKIKFNLNSLALIIVAGTLSLCHLSEDKTKIKDLESAIEILENENNLLKQHNDILQNQLNEINNVSELLLNDINTFFDKQNCTFKYYKNSGLLNIQSTRLTMDDDVFIEEIPEEIYYKINQFLILNPNAKILKLEGINGNVDFSRIDLSNIENIDLFKVGKNVNFSGSNLENLNTIKLEKIEEGFDCSAFENKNYDYISFDGDINFNSFKDILNNNNITNTVISISVYENNVNEILSYLRQYPTKIGEIRINLWSFSNYEETLELVSKLNADSVMVCLRALEDTSYESRIVTPLNINIELNPNINRFEIFLFSASHCGYFDVKEINITSVNSDAEVIIDSSYMSRIDENTEINVPNFDKFRLMLYGELNKSYQKKIGN